MGNRKVVQQGHTPPEITIPDSSIIWFDIPGTGGFPRHAPFSIVRQMLAVLPLAPQALSGAGAISVLSYKTDWSTTAANAGTLGDGVFEGQEKVIQMVADIGDGTLTPTNLNGGTTITFADVGDTAHLVWYAGEWVAIDLYNRADGASAPALA